MRMYGEGRSPDYPIPGHWLRLLLGTRKRQTHPLAPSKEGEPERSWRQPFSGIGL
ncbi:MAG: hypothetical protein AAGD25_30065 [Cyanobacteria bacterium P01_F01_bin.150]